MDIYTERALVEAEERYNVKVAKYPKEQLDNELRSILWEEACREGFAAGYISERGVRV